MKSLDLHGARIAYAESGPAEAPTLLLVHGFPLSHAMWSEQVRDLSDRYRVVAPDLRGYGESTLGGWPGAAEPTLDRYADDLVLLLERVSARRPIVVVGFSMGGYIALAMLRRRPACFDALALVDTRAAADDEAARATRLKMAEHVDEWGAARVAELMRPKLFAPGTPPAVTESTVALIASTDPAAIAASQRAMAARPDSTPLLGRIDKPTLVVVGEHDAISPPAEMRAMANEVPGARFTAVLAAGHMAPVEQPAAVNTALRKFAEELPKPA